MKPRTLCACQPVTRMIALAISSKFSKCFGRATRVQTISARPRLLLVLLHGQYWCGLIARVWRQLRDLAREVDRDPLRPDAQNNALGFRIAGDDTTFALLDRYNFRCF